VEGTTNYTVLVVIRMGSLFIVVNDERLFACFTVESPWSVNSDVSTDVSAGEIQSGVINERENE